MPAKKCSSCATRSPKLVLMHLDEIIAEARVDCYNAAEQIAGIYTMLEENLALPFTATVLGVEVTIDRIELTNSEEVVAVCRRQGHRQQIPLLDLPLPAPRPAGGEWMDAYRLWARWNLKDVQNDS